jgi:glycosyltransferase involved in cell wall biosynthesis
LVASFCSQFLKPEMHHIYRQVTSLREWQTFVLTKERQNNGLFPFADVEVMPPARMPLFRRAYLKYIVRAPRSVYRGEYESIRRVLVRRDPQLMHVYFGHTAVHLLPLIEAWDRPAIVSFHGMDVAVRPKDPRHAVRLRRLFEVVPLVLARSRSLAAHLIHAGCPEDKIRLNRAGIPLRQFYPVERLPVTEGRWKLVQACRLIPKKGIPTTLAAFRIFLQHYPNAELTIAGDGPLREGLEQQVREMSLENRIRFAGFLGQQPLFELLCQSHIFVHPSETMPDANQEGVPNSMLEAMATGLPIIATRHGGIPEVVTEGESGYLVGERDAEALAKALLKLAANPPCCARLGAAAARSVREEFELSGQIRRLESYYSEAVELFTGRGRPSVLRSRVMTV